MEEIKEKEAQKVLEELKGVRPEQLTGEAKRLFVAIMKIADERDELEKEYVKLLIKLNAQNLNNSIEQRKESNEQLEALNEGWKIELEKKDNRIKELESDKEIKDETIKLMSEHLTTPIHSKKDVIEYFENLAKVNLQSNKENIDTQDFKQKYLCEWNLKSNKESGDENVSRSN